MGRIQQTVVSMIMGLLLIVDELFDIRLHSLTEDYVAIVIGALWPLVVWLTGRGWAVDPRSRR